MIVCSEDAGSVVTQCTLISWRCLIVLSPSVVNRISLLTRATTTLGSPVSMAAAIGTP
jgi:hypothetical protein